MFLITVQPRKRGAVLPIADFPSIKGSPAASPATGKENTASWNAIASSTTATRKPFGAVTGRDNIPQAQPHVQLSKVVDGIKDKDRRRSRVLADLTANQNVERVKEGGKGKVKDKAGGKDHVRERVKEWEREKERLREMARLEEIEKERNEMMEEEERGREMAEWKERMEAARVAEEQQKEEEPESDKENRLAVVSPPVTSPTASTFMTGMLLLLFLVMSIFVDNVGRIRSGCRSKRVAGSFSERI
jgi:hypothetical protein